MISVCKDILSLVQTKIHCCSSLYLKQLLNKSKNVSQVYFISTFWPRYFVGQQNIWKAVHQLSNNPNLFRSCCSGVPRANSACFCVPHWLWETRYKVAGNSTPPSPSVGHWPVACWRAQLLGCCVLSNTGKNTIMTSDVAIYCSHYIIK